jgi:hypothetical protein
MSKQTGICDAEGRPGHNVMHHHTKRTGCDNWRADALVAERQGGREMSTTRNRATGPRIPSNQVGEMKPTYCPYCGANVDKWDHDDDCKRPNEVRLIIVEPPTPHGADQQGDGE